jgi:choline dehydrogenase-like flavoprotein
LIFDLNLDETRLNDKSYDVCIAGGGVAGIILALKLAKSKKNVLLLEAGELQYSNKSQSVYEGDVVGFEYYALDKARLRFLGGSSNHWAGWCRPLDAIDFTNREHIAGSEWPITEKDLRPFMNESLEIFDIEPFDKNSNLLDSEGRFDKIDFRYSQVFFNHRYSVELRDSDYIDLYLNANVTDIRLDTDSGKVNSFEVESHNRKRASQQAKANNFVLAMGGIENARILLNANSQVPQGIGNQQDLVGRFFMEHPVYDVGHFVANPAKKSFFDSVTFITPTAEFINKERIGNAGLRIRSVKLEDLNTGDVDRTLAESFKGGVKDLICLSETLREFLYDIRGTGVTCPNVPDSAGTLRIAFEQVPNKLSRVKLTNKVDKFGLRRVALDWQFSEMDKRTIQTTSLEVAKYFATADLGRVKINDWILEDDPGNFPGLSQGEEVLGFHHMGTTRMGSSPSDAVVDKNCRVFGTQNLYIAGSSVFRTGGHANPTFTIGQLALRLAQHLG